MSSEVSRQEKNSDSIMEDNHEAITLACNPLYYIRIKHIDVQYHFLRECVEMGKVELVIILQKT